MSDPVLTSLSVEQRMGIDEPLIVNMELYVPRDSACKINDLRSLSFMPKRGIVKCKHCGQYAARYTACVHCGAPVD